MTSTSDYDALGTKMGSVEKGPKVVVSSRGDGASKARGTRVVVWTVVGVIIVLAIVAIVVLATRQSNDDDKEDRLQHKVHHLHHEVKGAKHRAAQANQKAAQANQKAAQAQQALAKCEASKPIPGHLVPSGNKPIPGHLVPSGNKPIPGHLVPSGNKPIPGHLVPPSKPILPPFGPGPVIPSHKPIPGHLVPPFKPHQANLVNPGLYPPRTFAFNLAQIPSGHYQTYCPDRPDGRVHHDHLAPLGPSGHHGALSPHGSGVIELEPFVDTLGDHGLVTSHTPGVVQAPVQAPVQGPLQARGGMGHQAMPMASATPTPTMVPKMIPAVLSSGSSAPPSPSSSGPSVTHKSGEEAKAYLKMKPTGVMILVMDGCGFCTKIKQELPKLKTKHPITLVDAKHMKDLPKEYHVQGFPTLSFLKEGKAVKQHPGYMPAEKLDKMIGEILG